MYGDWSFPETSERIGQRRRGGRGGMWQIPFMGGGKDILLTKLGAWGTTCYAYFSSHDCSDIVRLLNLIAFVLGNIICDMIL